MKLLLITLLLVTGFSASAQSGANDFFPGYNFGYPDVNVKPSVPLSDIRRNHRWHDSTGNFDWGYDYRTKMVDTTRAKAIVTAIIANDTLNYKPAVWSGGRLFQFSSWAGLASVLYDTSLFNRKAKNLSDLSDFAAARANLGTALIANGGTNNTSFTTGALHYFDGAKIASATNSGGLYFNNTNGYFAVDTPTAVAPLTVHATTGSTSLAAIGIMRLQVAAFGQDIGPVISFGVRAYNDALHPLVQMGQIGFRRDNATSGSGTGYFTVVTGGIERMRINSTGQINITSPPYDAGQLLFGTQGSATSSSYQSSIAKTVSIDNSIYRSNGADSIYGLYIKQNIISPATFLISLRNIVGGSGYTDGTYTVGGLLTNSAGKRSGAILVVSGGSVTSVTVYSPAFGYANTDTITFNPSSISAGLATGTGFYGIANIGNATGKYAAINTTGDVVFHQLRNATATTPRYLMSDNDTIKVAINNLPIIGIRRTGINWQATKDSINWYNTGTDSLGTGSSGSGLDPTHPATSGGTPTVSNSAGTDISSISVSGHDAAMVLTFTVPTGHTINGYVCTITYNSAWSAAPIPSISISFDALNTTALGGTQIGAGEQTTTTFKVRAANLTAGTYIYNIKSMQ